MNRDASALLKFIRVAEKLKVELRHSYTSSIDRKESVAEHSWMLGLMAILIFDFVEIKVDQLKVMKMVIIHDLAEAITGDIPSFEKSKRQKNKFSNEENAMKEITKILPKKVATEILGLWYEMEEKKTNEAKVAQCLDKAEVLTQHNLADIKTWDQGDYDTNCYYRDEYFDVDKFLREFKDLINKQVWDKIVKNKKLKYVPKEAIEKHSASKPK